RWAAWLFRLFLVRINIFVVRIAAAGLIPLSKGSFQADSFVIGLPLSAGAEVITLLAFVGGLSAATAMVIVDSVALAIMVCNGLVLPLLLRRHLDQAGRQKDMSWLLLAVRRGAICGSLLPRHGFFHLLGPHPPASSDGL